MLNGLNKLSSPSVSPPQGNLDESSAPVKLGWWCIALSCLLVAPLLLPTRPMWDDVIMHHAIERGLQAPYREMVLSTNWYVTWMVLSVFQWLHASFGLPLVASYKLLTAALVLGIAAEVARLTRQIVQIDLVHARWVMPLVAAFPIWFVFYSYFCMSGHLFSLWLGLLGYRWWMHGRGWRQGLGAVVVAAGFQLASLCVFLPALALAEWLLHPGRRRQVAWRGAVMFGLAVLVYSATRLIWPPVELYEGYNKVVLPISATTLNQYVKYSVLYATWSLLLLPALAVWALARASGRSHGQGTGASAGSLNARPALVVMVFTMLIGAACLPYIMVGVGGPLWVIRLGSESSYSAALVNKPGASTLGLWYGGWHARQAMVLMLPICMGVVWVAYRVAARSRRWSAAVIGLSLALSVGLLLPGYWAKLQRAAYETSLVNYLRSVPPPPSGLLRVVLPADADFALDSYEMNYLLFEAHGATRWLSFAASERLHSFALPKREALLKTPVQQRELIGMAHVMEQFDWSRQCGTGVWLEWPRLSVTDVLWTAHWRPRSIPPTRATRTASTCPDASAYWQGDPQR